MKIVTALDGYPNVPILLFSLSPFGRQSRRIEKLLIVYMSRNPPWWRCYSSQRALLAVMVPKLGTGRPRGGRRGSGAYELRFNIPQRYDNNEWLFVQRCLLFRNFWNFARLMWLKIGFLNSGPLQDDEIMHIYIYMSFYSKQYRCPPSPKRTKT